MTSVTDAESRLDEKIAELDEKIREANGTLKDIRQAKREIDAAIKDFGENVERRLETHVQQGLGHFSEQIDSAVQGATQAVYNRFDLIAALCLGEDARARSEGKTPLPELVAEYIRLHGPVTP
jgi:BMFP domain-containing protein YqiC